MFRVFWIGLRFAFHQPVCEEFIKGVQSMMHFVCRFNRMSAYTTDQKDTSCFGNCSLLSRRCAMLCCSNRPSFVLGVNRFGRARLDACGEDLSVRRQLMRQSRCSTRQRPLGWFCGDVAPIVPFRWCVFRALCGRNTAKDSCCP